MTTLSRDGSPAADDDRSTLPIASDARVVMTARLPGRISGVGGKMMTRNVKPFDGKPRVSALAALVLGGLICVASARATTLYSNDFSSTASGGFNNSYTDLTTYTTGTATFPSAITNSFPMSQTTGTGGAYASKSVTMPPTANSSFTETASLVVTSASSSTAAGPAVGLRALGTLATGTPTTIDEGAYWGDISFTYGSSGGTNATGLSSVSIRIFDKDSGGTNTSNTANLPNFTFGDTYNLTFTGTYNAAGTSLALSFMATDVSNSSSTATVPFTDPTPETGTNFGFRGSAGSAASYSATYDNLVVSATPEPASMGLVGMAALGLLVRRRRTRI